MLINLVHVLPNRKRSRAKLTDADIAQFTRFLAENTSSQAERKKKAVYEELCDNVSFHPMTLIGVVKGARFLLGERARALECQKVSVSLAKPLHRQRRSVRKQDCQAFFIHNFR